MQQILLTIITNFSSLNSTNFHINLNSKTKVKKSRANLNKINETYTRFSTVNRPINHVGANLAEWIKNGRLCKIFTDVRKSLRSNKNLELNQFGIKRTPIYRISQREKKEQARVKRKDFIHILKCEQELIKSTTRKSQSIEKSMYDNLDECVSENRNSISDINYNTPLKRVVAHNDQRMMKHLTNLRFRNGSFEVYRNISSNSQGADSRTFPCNSKLT